MRDRKHVRAMRTRLSAVILLGLLVSFATTENSWAKIAGNILHTASSGSSCRHVNSVCKKCGRCKTCPQATGCDSACESKCGEGCDGKECGYKKRTVKKIEYRQETRHREVIVYRSVPHLRRVTETYVDHVYRTFTDMVPHASVHTQYYEDVRARVDMVTVATAQQTKLVRIWHPVSELNKVKIDYGHYEEVPCEEGEACHGHAHCGRSHDQCNVGTYSGNYGSHSTAASSQCGGGYGGDYVRNIQPYTYTWPKRDGRHCCSAKCHRGSCDSSGKCQDNVCKKSDHKKCCSGKRTRRVWVADVHEIEMPVTTMHAVSVEQPGTSVSVVQPVTTLNRLPGRTYDVRTVLRPRCIVRAVPVTRTRTYYVTEYERVPERITETYIESIPYEVEREIKVPVCKQHKCKACQKTSCH